MSDPIEFMISAQNNSGIDQYEIFGQFNKDNKEFDNRLIKICR